MDSPLERQQRLYCYVVEGKTDEDKLKKLGIRLVIKTNGMYIAKETRELLKAVSRVRCLIFATDPDLAGKRIRRGLENILAEKDYQTIKTSIKESAADGKIGVAQMSVANLKKALAPFLAHDEDSPEKLTITMADLIGWHLAGPKSHGPKQKLEDRLGLTFADAKHLLSGLWLLGLTSQQVEEILA